MGREEREWEIERERAEGETEGGRGSRQGQNWTNGEGGGRERAVNKHTSAILRSALAQRGTNLLRTQITYYIRERERERDRQTDRQTDRQADRQTGAEKERTCACVCE